MVNQVIMGDPATGSLPAPVITRLATEMADPASDVGAALSGTFATKLASTLVVLGDSQTAQGSTNAGTNDVDTGTYGYVFNNTGYLGWLQTLLGNRRFNLLRNAGVSGERTDQILARVPSVVADNPNWCIVLAGANDILQSVSEATIKTNLAAIYDGLLAAGIRVVAVTILPNDSATTTAHKQAIHGTNAWMRDYARSHPGMVLIDVHAALANPSTGNYATNMSSDGTHVTAFGSYRMAKVMADTLAPLLPPTLSLLGSNADPYNLSTNGRMQGTAGWLTTGITGDVADLWSTGWDGAAGTAVMSKVARTDGVEGTWQQVQATSAGTFRMFQQANPLSAWGLTVGDSVYIEVEFEADQDWASVIRFGFDIEWFNGGVGITSCLYNASAVYGTANPTKGVLRSPIGVIPPTAARAQAFIRFHATAGTVRFDRARIVKV